jgi:hypothetical protein
MLRSHVGWLVSNLHPASSSRRTATNPSRLLAVHIGGLDLSAIVGGRGWERLGWKAFLFRTRKGNFFVQSQST